MGIENYWGEEGGDKDKMICTGYINGWKVSFKGHFRGTLNK